MTARSTLPWAAAQKRRPCRWCCRPHLTRLEVLVPSCRPGMFWRHIAACSQLVSLTVHTESSSGAAADHPSWMLHQLASSLPNLQHFTLDGFGHCAEHTLPQVLGLLAATEAGQQQQEEQGWDWEDLAGLGLEPGTDFKSVVVPPPNMGAFTALRTLEFPTGYGYSFRCCGPHHWRALAGCKGLQQLRGFEAWGMPPAGVKFPGVTDLQILVGHPLRDTVAVLGAFPALQQLDLKLNAADTQQAQAGAGNEEQEEQQQQHHHHHRQEEEGQTSHQQQQEEVEGQQQQQQGQAAGATQEGQPAQEQAQQVALCTAQPDAALLLGSLTSTTIRLTGKGLGAGQLERSSTLWHTLWGAMRALQRLELQWPYEVDLLPQLPPMAAFTGLTSLNLRSKRYGIRVDSFQHVDLLVLLELLQECSRLKEVKLEVGVGFEGAAAGAAGSIPGGSGSQDGSGVGVDSSGGDSSCGIGWDSLLRCLQRLLPSLQRLLHEPIPKDLERAFWG